MIYLAKFIFSDTMRCNGCGICELICSWYKEESFNPLLSRIKKARIGLANVATACRFCKEPPCVVQCPTKALTQKDGGIIVVDKERCDGCGWCIDVCPYGAISIHPERFPLICDLCDNDPQCVKICPTDALILVDQNELSDYINYDLIERELGGI